MTTTLVLGASRGIGLEFVRQCREAGDRVIATARTSKGLQALEKLGAQTLQLDVADPASISNLARAVHAEKIDLALYVAGVYSTAGATEPPTQQDFDRLMHTNVRGAMQVIPNVAPRVEAAKGRFVFITSGMAQIAGAGSSFGWLYRVSKAALNMAVAAARHDYPAATLVAMSPGWVQTDMGGPGAPLTVQQSVASMRKAIAAITPRQSGAFLDHDGTPFEGW
jgi:NAD(P)-dependent dehydrogenase (short-subunit alcohol dehydrogenase family)